MPTFTQDVEVHIDVEEFIDECSDYNKEWLIKLLIEDGYLKENCRVQQPDPSLPSNPSEYFYNEAIDKLSGRWNMLTREEEDTILKIANRLP